MANSHSKCECERKVIHQCPLCKIKMDCFDSDCIELFFEFCDDCRCRIVRYWKPQDISM